MSYTKEELTPYALQLFKQLKTNLSPEFAQRLRSMEGFSNHSSYRTLFLFDIWDGNQTDVIHRHHFKYCLGCDNRPRAKCEGYLQLWINRIRIYRNREDIVATLDNQLPTVIPKEFISRCSDQVINYKFEFSYPKNLTELSELLLPRYISLISAVHPVLMPIIDQFTKPLEKGERRAVVAKRGRISFTPTGVYDRVRVREYTRSIPPTWKPKILEKHDHKCVLCGCDLRKFKYHIDHIIPFSKGGETILENLQPLCASCNLTKGNR